MKRIILPAAIVPVLLLSSCYDVPPGPGYYPPSPGYRPPPVVGPPPGPNLSQQAKDEAYRQGFGFGRRDGSLGRNANYMVYNNYYTSATKKDFAAGYMAGYRRGSRR
jgi:hypothetical protein